MKYLKDKETNNLVIYKTKKNIFYLLLVILFFVGFGEEISWGQRILNFETPEALKQVNLQNETNIHNIVIFHGTTPDGKQKDFVGKLLNIDRLFSFFWFSFCLIIPVLSKANRKIYSLIRSLNVPLVPLWLGTFFLINYILSKIFETIRDPQLLQPIVEIKESNIAFLFAVLSLHYILPHILKSKNN